MHVSTLLSKGEPCGMLYCLSSIIIMGFSQIEFGMALPTTIWLPCYFPKFCKFSLNLSIFWWYKTYFVRHDVFGKHVMSEHLPKLKMKTIEGGLRFLSCDVLTYCCHFWFKTHFGVLCGAFCDISFSVLLILTRAFKSSPKRLSISFYIPFVTRKMHYKHFWPKIPTMTLLA